MSVPYGRYVISYDKEDQMWNADPKGKTVHVNKAKSTFAYTFPDSRVFAEKTLAQIMQKMRDEGAGAIHCRNKEWVVQMKPAVSASS